MTKKEKKNYKHGDIITDESGNEIGRMLNSATLDEMKECPEAFLLNEAETILVKKALQIISGINEKYRDIPEKDLAGNSDYKALVCSEFTSQAKIKRLPLTKLEKIAYKSTVCQFWTERLISIDFGEKYNEGLYERLQIEISDPDIKISPDNTIDSQTKHEYFKKNRAEKARILGIPNIYGYINSIDLDVLRILTAVFNHKTSLKENEAVDDETFYKIISSKPLNATWAIGQNIKNPKIKKDRDEKGKQIDLAEYSTKMGINISFANFNPFESSKDISVGDPNTDKLLLQTQLNCRKTGRQAFDISLTDFMSFRGITDRKTALEQAKRACNTLAGARYTIDSETEKGGLYGFVNYVQECYVVKSSNKGGNRIYINLSDKLYQHILNFSDKGQQIEQIDKKVATIPNNQQTAYNIFRAFSYHLRASSDKETSHRLSVSNLLEYCCALPLYPARKEDAGKENYLRNRSEARDRIITPFVKALDYLVEKGFFTEYTFTHAKGKPLSNAELQKVYDDYSLFISLNVNVIFTNEPDYEHLNEKKAKQKAKAETVKKTKAKQEKKTKKEKGA